MFNRDQFILSKLVPDQNGKTIKIPCNASGVTINALDPENWMSLEEAESIASTRDDFAVAFVFTKDDPYFFVDIDHCLMSDGESWSPLAYEILNLFPGAYVEVSQSGTGLHIFGSYTQMPAHGCKNTSLGIEFYHENRFAVLGSNAMGDTGIDCTHVLPGFVDKYFKPKVSAVSQDTEWTTGPVEEWSGPTDDDELIKLACSKRSVSELFSGAKVAFVDLWEANEEALARAWPHEYNAYDASSADMSLAQRLAYWTGKNCERIERLMRQSALMRDKWDTRSDYLKRTIFAACGMQTKVYVDRAKVQSGVSRKFAGGFVDATEIPEVFDGCVYIIGDHQAVTPDGLRLKPDQFKVMYGGYKFNIDDGKTTRNAWEAFTECPTWRPPTAHNVCFRPEDPDHIIEDGGETLANIYRPIIDVSEPGDVSRFTSLVDMMFGAPRDREILLAYMAACTQYKGRKFQWAPLLQGPEGNGKTFLTNCLMNALGKKYCHVVKASDLAGNGAKFNAWLFGKLFIAIEEIKVGNKVEMMEVLKPLITNEKEEIQAKGRDQFTGDNRANFILTSNYLDALNLKVDSRRYAPLMSTAQTYEAMKERGLTPAFFADLWNWAKGVGEYDGKTPGFNHITYYLNNYKIPDELNPAVACVRAPMTTRRDEFVKASAGRVEQEIIEAIGQGEAGFAGGWVSSSALDRLLIGLRIHNKVSHTKRKEILMDLGFVPHPALPDNGRSTAKVYPDGGRPRLFIRQGHPAMELTTPVSVAEAYSRAQREAEEAGPSQGQVVSLR